jgi:hypothetical protein
LALGSVGAGAAFGSIIFGAAGVGIGTALGSTGIAGTATFGSTGAVTAGAGVGIGAGMTLGSAGAAFASTGAGAVGVGSGVLASATGAVSPGVFAAQVFLEHGHQSQAARKINVPTKRDDAMICVFFMTEVPFFIKFLKFEQF